MGVQTPENGTPPAVNSSGKIEARPGATGSPPAAESLCVECGRLFPMSEIVDAGGLRVCGGCKAAVLERVSNESPWERYAPLLERIDNARYIRVEHLPTERRIKFLGSIFLAVGLGWMCFSFLWILVGLVGSPTEFGVNERVFGRDSKILGLPMPIFVRAATLTIGILSFLGGWLQRWIGSRIRKFQKRAVIPASILIFPYLLVFPIGTLIGAYILTLFYGEKGKYIFSDDYKKIIQATPELGT